MPDEKLAAASAQPGDATPVTPSPAQGGGQGEGALPPTLAQVESLITKHVSASEERARRSSQKLLDTQANTLQQRFRAELAPINKAISQMEAAGQTVPEELKTKLRNAALMEAIDPAEAQGVTASGDGRQTDTRGAVREPGPVEGLDLIGQLAVSIQQQSGIWIGDNDPELAIIDQQTTDPQVFGASLQKAIRTKAARMAGPEAQATFAALEAESSESESENESGEGTKVPTGPGLNARGSGKKAGGKYLEGVDGLANLHLGYGASD